MIPAVEALVSHLERAAGAAGASDSLQTHAGHVSRIAAGMLAHAHRAADIAGQLAEAVSIRRAAPLVGRLQALAYQIAEGFDADGDGQMALDGEAGMQQLEAHLYLLLEGESLPRELR